MAADTVKSRKRKRPFISLKEFEQVTDPFLNDGLVTIMLEGIEEHFTVSKALLCHASNYFTKALDGRFREGKEGILTLPGCDAPTLRLFIGYMTCKALPAFHKMCYSDTASESENIGLMSEIQSSLINLWSFGDRHIIPGLCNMAMRSLVRVLGCSYTLGSAVAPESIQLAFDTTGKESILCKMLISEFVQDWKEKKVDTDALDRVGSIQGLMAMFLEEMDHSCGIIECSHDIECRPSEQYPLDGMYLLHELLQ